MKKLLLLIPLLLLSSCGGDKHIYVSTILTDKWDKKWIQTISTGKITITIPHHDYYFVFNEWKPYTKKVSQADYETFDIGDTYTFIIDEKEKSYFFADSIVEVNENDG